MSNPRYQQKKPKILFVGSFIDQNTKKERGGMLIDCGYLVNSEIALKADFIKFDSTNESIPIPPLTKRIVGAVRRFFKFIKTLVTDKPDLVLMYSSGGLSFIEKGLLVAISKSLNIPVIWSIRSGAFIDQVKNSKVFSKISKFLLSFPDIILCQGETWKKFYINDLSIRQEKLKVILNWIEPSKFLAIPERPQKNLPSSDINLLFVGWVNRTKGIFELLDVVSEIKNNGINIKLDIVGKGEDFEAALNKSVANNQLNKSIYFHEWLSGNQLIECFKKADMLVLPTYAEGFPNVILEAMASGLPVITTPVGSIPDVISHGKNGLLIKPKDKSALKEAILSLRDNPNQRSKMGLINRDQVIENHNIDKLSNKVWEIIQNIIRQEVKVIKPKVLFIGSFLDKDKREERGGMLASCSYLIESNLKALVEFILLDSTNATIPPPPLIKRFLSAVKRFFKFTKILVINKPNVILIYSSGGLSFIEKGLLVIVAKIFFKPVIWSIRSGVFLHQIEKSKIFLLLSKLLLSFPDVIICQGQTAALAYSDKLKIDRNKIKVLPNWIEPSKFLVIPEKKLKNFSEENFNLLFIGWVNKAKGVYELLDAMAQLKNENINVKLDIVGKGEDFETAVSKVKAVSGLDSSIFFHEWLSGDKLIERFEKASVLVLPTYAEGFPNVILEAMAASLPIITTPVGSITDVIVHKRNGLIIEPQNIDQLKKAILYFRNNPEICLEMGKINKVQVLDNHGIDKLSNELWKIIQKLLQIDDQINAIQ